MKKNKVFFDRNDDVLYIAAKKGSEEEFIEVMPGVSVELDKNKKVIGIEILNASRFLSPFIKKVMLKRT